MPERATRKPQSKTTPPPEHERAQGQATPDPLSQVGNQALGALAGNPAAVQALLATQAGAGNQAVQRLAQSASSDPPVQRVLEVRGKPVTKIPTLPSHLSYLTPTLQTWATDGNEHVYADWGEAAAAAAKVTPRPTGDSAKTAKGTTNDDDEQDRTPTDAVAARQFLVQNGFQEARIHDPRLTDQNCHSYAIGIERDLQDVTPVSLADHIARNVRGKTILLCLRGGVVAHTAVQVRPGIFRQTLPGGPIFDTTRSTLDSMYQCYLLPADLPKLRRDAKAGGW